VSGVKGTRWGHYKPCPSWSAYKLHLRSREVPCEPCREFVRDARQARRAAERAERDYRESVAAWRAEHEASVRRQQERDVRAVVAVLAEAFAEAFAERCRIRDPAASGWPSREAA